MQTQSSPGHEAVPNAGAEGHLEAHPAVMNRNTNMYIEYKGNPIMVLQLQSDPTLMGECQADLETKPSNIHQPTIQT